MRINIIDLTAGANNTTATAPVVPIPGRGILYAEVPAGATVALYAKNRNSGNLVPLDIGNLTASKALAYDYHVASLEIAAVVTGNSAAGEARVDVETVGANSLL